MSEIKALRDEIMKAVTDMQAANDERLAALKKELAPDAALVNHVENANKAITDLQAQLREVETLAARPKLSEDVNPAKAAHRDAFLNFIRTGNESGLAAAQAAVSVGVPADGGYAVPEEIDRQIEEFLKIVSPTRQLVSSVTVGTPDYKKLVNKKGTASGWVGETTARTATATSALEEVPAINGEIYAFPQATQQSLEDLFFNVEAWLASEIAEEFAMQEGAAFVSGNGTNKPKGFLAYTTAATADSARAFGVIEHKATGAAAALRTVSATASPADDLIDIVHAMKPGYRQGSKWAMNTLTIGAFRKVKDLDGNYIWRPGMESGASDTILGFPVVDVADMPVIAANALAAALINPRAYLIVDRVGTGVSIRDPFTNKPYVGFYVTKRVGGMLVNSEAIKVLKIAAA
jgi:HK97 family phage major capsid protein